MTTTSPGSAVGSGRRSWNDTTTPYERDQRIEAVVRARVEEAPDSIAVVDGERRLTYRQLWNGADAIARNLGALFGDLDRDHADAFVAVIGERSLETITAFLGAMMAGAAYVPIDPGLPSERRRFIFEDAAPSAVLCRRDRVDVARELAATPLVLEDLIADPVSDVSAPLAAIVQRPMNSPAYVMYTSGSTGRPKGVLVEHRGVLRFVRGAASLLPRPGEGVLCTGRLGFDLSTYEIWSALTNGARVVLSPPGPFDPGVVATTVEEGDVGVALLSTGVFHSLVDTQLHRLSSLRLVMACGDVLSPLHARRFVQAHPRCRLVNAYGPTETTIVASVFEVTAIAANMPVPIGRPLDNTTLYVLDEHAQPVPDGGIGELYIGGDGVARGYLNLPELTAERFVVDPFEPGSDRRLYRSGDRVRLGDDGELEFLGRFDEQVKIRGFRVEPAEVESVLLTNQAVGQVVVIAREDVPGRKRLVGYVVAASPTSPSALRRWCADRLPDFAVPSAIVVLDELPLTEIGKVDRSALPAPVDLLGDREQNLVPATPSEVLVAKAWQSVLMAPEVAIDDDFFDSGGDSLLALALLAEIRSRAGIELAISRLFELRTLGAIAEALDEASPIGQGPRRHDIALALGEPHPESGPTVASVSQAQVCFLSELVEGSLPYQSQSVIWLDGALDVVALEAALAAVIRRNEVLRSTFPSVHGIRMLQPQGELTVRLPVVDLTSEDSPDEAFSRLARRCVAERIDLDSAPIVRWTLAKLSGRRHALVQVEHHVVHDGVSFTLFLEELVRAYEAVIAGGSPPPASRWRYSDFAQWQQGFVDSPEGRGQLEYWRARLSDAPPLLQLPSSFRRPRLLSSRGRSIRRAMDPRLFDSIHELASALGATPYMVMFSAFALLLQRMSGQEDLIVGSGLANRRVRGSERLLGMLVNTLPLRFELEPTMSVADLIRHTRERCLEAYEAQELPFEALTRALAPDRDGGQSPLWRHLFSFHDAPFPSLDLPDLSVIPRDIVSNGSAKADLNVIVVNRRQLQRSHADHWAGDPELAPEDERPSIVWEYSTDLYDERDATALLDRYLALLEAMIANPEQAVSNVPMLVGDERASLAGSAGPSIAIERDMTIDSLFKETVRRYPGRIALDAARDVLTYHDLDLRVEHLASELRRRGVERGHCVGVVDDRTFEMVVALLAIVRVGAAYVGLDPAIPAERFAHIVEETEMRVICASDVSALGPLRAHLADAPALQLLSVDTAADSLEAMDLFGGAGPCADDRAYVCFTSGSTGEPKGVEVAHRGVVRLVRGPDYVRLDADETLCAMAPLSFDASTFEIWGALLNGARLVIAPSGSLSAAEIAETLRGGGVTTAWLTAGLFHEMVVHEAKAFGSLRQLLTGGDVLSPERVNLALQALPEGAVLINGYGPTEATTFASAHVMPAGTKIDGRVPIGTPIANTVFRLLDPSGEPVPDGVVGELYLGGDGVARGYLGQPELTAERFVVDRFDATTAGRLYRTGDLVVRRRDGVFEFVGRADRQVKLRGFRIEPAEVEYALTRHPDVAQCVVTAVDFGADDRRLVAYLTERPGARDEGSANQVDARRPDDEALRRHLSPILPRYMWPSRFIWMDELPRSANGKLDSARLPVPALTWVPTGDGLDASHPAPHAELHLRREQSKPSSRLQLRLIELFQETLGVKPVGLDDNFFDLGGHSLLAVALFAEIERATGARLPLSVIFEAPTVAGLSKLLREGGWDAAFGSLVPLTTSGSRPPLYLVTAGDGNTVGFGALARRLGPEQPFYALQPRGLDGRTMLQSSVRRMARHYVAQVREVQPHGPYLLGGRCFGTLVAYEMTRRLEAMGEKVSVLFALDSVGPLWEPRLLANGLPFDEVMNLARVYEGQKGSADDAVFTEPAAADAFVSWLQETVAARAQHRISRYLHAAWLARPDLQAAYPLDGDGHAGLLYWAWIGGRAEMGMNSALLGEPPTIARGLRRSIDPRHVGLFKRGSARLLDVVDVATRGRVPQLIARRQARLLELASLTLLEYRGGPIDARVALIRSEEYRNDAQVARWWGLATGGVEEFFIDGSHLSMVREPDVASLAQAIAGRIEAIVPSGDGLSIS